jgi:hypothetical protein
MNRMSGMRRVGIAGITILLLTPGAASADAPSGSSLQERREYEARDLLQVAASQVERDRACRPRPVSRRSTTAAPSATMLSALAPLRRPQLPEDLQGIASQPPGSIALYTNYVRLVHAADDTALTIAPIPNFNLFEARPQRCVSQLRARFREAISGRPAAFRRVARHELRSEVRFAWAPVSREGITVFYPGGGFRGDLATLRRRGVYGATGSLEAPGTTSLGVVPDGVASIDFVFRRSGRVLHRATVAVRENAVSLHVQLGLSAWMAEQVWRAADGSVIRTVRPR